MNKQFVAGKRYTIDYKIDNVILKGGSKNPLQGKVSKVVIGIRVTMCAPSTYEGAVKLRLIQEGKDPNSFKVKTRPWGKRIDDTPYIVHGEETYVEFLVDKQGKTSYFVDGIETDASLIEGLKEDVNAKQGLTKPVVVRTINVNSIMMAKEIGVNF